MSRISPEDRDGLLADLSQMGSSGRAEGERKETFAKTFFPVPEHARAFDPDVVLILGERGAGKSEIFRAVVQEGLLDSILRRVPSGRSRQVTASNAQWLSGHPLHRDFPDDPGLRLFIKDNRGERDAMTTLWFAYLTRLLKLGEDEFIALPGAEVQQIVTKFHSAGNKPLLLLDDLDRQLENEDRWIFVSYDELDILGGHDWEAMVAAIQGLISFWVSYSRRWSRIRAKIFLRTDLFRRHAQVLGADLSKLAANRAEISWSDRNLYSMLVKRIANTSDGLADYCRRSRIKFDEDPKLGLVPVLQRAEDARPLIERLVGQYMGAEKKKGSTFRWMLGHVRDGNGHAMPRALVRLIEEAAQQERSVQRAGFNRLLAPASIRRALDKVSQEHVLSANTDELPWLPGVARRLQGLAAPINRRDAENALNRDWEASWGKDSQEIHPPVAKPPALADYLVEVGVFRQRPDGRIDVPDLFLAGLGMTRKGGVTRR